MDVITEQVNFYGHALADIVTENPYQIFTICHIALTLLSIKNEWVSSNSKKNPLACYLLGLACCNAGGIITAVLTNNKTILECLFFGKADVQTMMIYTIIWWATFYFPGSIYTKILQSESLNPETKKIVKKATVIQQVLIIGKEALRCKKIYTGVALGATLYVESGKISILNGEDIPFCIILGTIASNGTGFLVNIGKFITARPYSGLTLLGTSVLGKFSVIFAFLYTVYPEFKYQIVLLQFIVLLNYKLKMTKIDSFIDRTFDLIGNKVTDLGSVFVVADGDIKENKEEKKEKKKNK